MAPYVKSLDSNHLLTVGLEGFYGAGAHESKALNPWGIYYGTNYVATHRAAGVDFATIHLYPDVWLWGSTATRQAAFLRNWTRAHVRDTELYLGTPLLVTEYGKFLWDSNRTQRHRFLGMVLDSIYASASGGGPLVGGAFWQLLDGGMDTLRDGYEIILPEDRRAAGIIRNHSRQLAQLNGQDAEEIRRRRNRLIRTHHHDRKIRVGGSEEPVPGSRSRSSTASHTDTPWFRILLLRSISLFRQISSFFSGTY
jgi:mannan endo-1,4-beta-mannosidase